MSADVALSYAAHGYRVLPAYVIKQDDGSNRKVSASKDVLVKYCAKHDHHTARRSLVKDCQSCKGGHHAATTDPREIKRMWRLRPTALVAVIPPPSVLILDDDSHVFDDVWGALPRVRSVSGKHHYYLRLRDDQEPLRSTNGIEFSGDGLVVDIRGPEGGLWIIAPSGCGGYVPENDWTPDPALLPECPAEVYERLLSAPRVSRAGTGGAADGHHTSGLPDASPGNWLDVLPGACEELLERHGWTRHSGAMWTRPQLRTATAGPSASLTCSDGVWFFNVFTGSPDAAPLQAGRYYTASMLRCIFEFNNDWTRCYIQLLRENGDFQ